MTPFRQGLFEELPERPRLAHRFFEIPAERVVVPSAHFGAVGLSVRRVGRGEPLVCVHGLMTSSYSFRYLIDRLSGEYELVLFDLPGAGRSDAPDVSYGAPAMADLVGDLMRVLGVEGARVLGNSMGGYLCMWLALRRPGAIGRLVNLHSPGIASPRMHALELALRVPGSDAILDALVRRDPERWAHRNVHYYDESLKSREEAREYGAPLARPEGRRAFTRYLRDTLSARTMGDFERALRALGGRFPVPLQLLYARRDPMVPPIVGARLARILPSAELAWLEEGSHFAHVDAPDAFLAAARPFLTAVARGARAST